MQEVEKWKAHYKDEKHDADIVLINTKSANGSVLSFEMDGIIFKSTDLITFEIEEAQYENAKQHFHILKMGNFTVGSRYTCPYWYVLQRFALSILLPVMIQNKATDEQTEGNICYAFRYAAHDMDTPQCICKCGDDRVWMDDLFPIGISLTIGTERYVCRKRTVDMETALQDISEQIGQNYLMKCCFTCQYSDYSPYGSDAFGSMMCYRDCKEKYLKVNNKTDYFNILEGEPFVLCQENDLCTEYRLRNICGGYRGWVGGIGGE